MTPFGCSAFFSLLCPAMLFFFLLVQAWSDSVSIETNPWVFDVPDMNFRDNPMVSTWLYCRDRQRWARWMIGFSLPFIFLLSSCLLLLLSRLHPVSIETYLIGFAIGIVFTTLSAFTLYQTYWKGWTPDSSEQNDVAEALPQPQG